MSCKNLSISAEGGWILRILKERDGDAGRDPESVLGAGLRIDEREE